TITRPRCICHLSRALSHPVHHSFPTRRSSDLDATHGRLRVPSQLRYVIQGVPGVTQFEDLLIALGVRLTSPVLAFLLGLSNALRSEEHTSELQSRENLVCRLLLEKKQPCTVHF